MKNPLILTDSIRIFTISDLLDKNAIYIPTKKGLEMEIKPEGKGYFWYPKNHTPGEPVQVLATRKGEGMSGTYWDGEFKWNDQPYPELKKIVRFTAKHFKYKPIGGKYHRSGLPLFHEFPLIFYITEEFKSLEGFVFEKMDIYENYITWTIYDTKQGKKVLGKVVACKIFADDNPYNIDWKGIMIMGSREKKLAYSFGNAESKEMKKLAHENKEIWNEFHFTDNLW